MTLYAGLDFLSIVGTFGLDLAHMELTGVFIIFSRSSVLKLLVLITLWKWLNIVIFAKFI